MTGLLAEELKMEILLPKKKFCFKKKQPMRTIPYLRMEDFLIMLCAVCAIKAITTQENVMTTRYPELPPPAVLRDAEL